MKRHNFIAFSAIIALMVISAYTIHFHNTQLSDNTSDWGAWGSYVSIGISILSITLIYVTYKEQQESNRISRFVDNYHVSLKTLSELFAKNNHSIKLIYNMVNQKFTNPLDDLSEYEQDNIKKLLGYFYDSAINHINNEKDEAFFYLFFTLNTIKSNNISNKEEQKRCITEISCIIPDYARILFLCWGCHNNYSVTSYYNLGLYRTRSIKNECLKNIVRFACTGIRPQKEETIEGDYNLDCDSPEDYQKTYKRLFNNKTKQQ